MAVLNVLWWHGDVPEVGDVLETSTGRRYLIQRFRLSRPSNGHTTIRAFETVVLPKDEKIAGARVFPWTWGSRQRRLGMRHATRAKFARRFELERQPVLGALLAAARKPR
jgi:hypothetical protein